MSGRRARWFGVVALVGVTLGHAAEPASAPRPPIRWSAVNDQPAAWYGSDDARRIAANVLTYQQPTGGWPKNTDMTQPRPAAGSSHVAPADNNSATIDNGGTTTQVEFLARIHSALPDDASAAAALRGIDYLLEAQYPNGGWPQFFPLRKGYYTHITYNDNATAHVLEVLRGVRDAAPPYAWVDATHRERARSAIDRAVDCILRTQVRQDGRLTAWCAQHDEQTFEPVWARNFEPPSLSGNETVGLVRFLMSIDRPAPAIVAAIEAAVNWLEASKITGLRVESFTAEDGKRDRRAVADENATALWARFYELGTNRPIFIGRDRVIRYDYNEIERERRVGYAYLGDWPRTLLERDYPQWRARRVARPDAVVATDGSGDFKSLQEAISRAPMRTGTHDPRWVIHVKPGTYRERIYVQRERGNILVRGEDAATTTVVFDLNANLPGEDGKPIGTFRTPTVQVDGDGMIWENLTLANDAGPIGQALALRADGDRLVFRHCRFLGWQDTILLNRGRHYFEDCYIEGHVDFIFGAATAYFSRCHIHVLRDGYITAASTPQGAAHGYVFADCRITGAGGARAYLGRPWREYARTVFLRTEMSGHVRPEGWHNWNKPHAEQTTFYAEFGSTGPGANPDSRVKWAKPLTADEVAALTPEQVLAGADGWNPVR